MHYYVTDEPKYRESWKVLYCERGKNISAMSPSAKSKSNYIWECVPNWISLSLSLKFIRCNRPPKLTLEDALEEVLQEMRDYHYIWSAHLQNCRSNKLHKEKLSFTYSMLLCNAKCRLFFKIVTSVRFSMVIFSYALKATVKVYCINEVNGIRSG